MTNVYQPQPGVSGGIGSWVTDPVAGFQPPSSVPAHTHDGGDVAVGAWTTYTPVLTAATVNPTLGPGAVQEGRYARLGRTVIGQAAIFFGTSGVAAGTGEYRISMPPPSALEQTTDNVLVGSGYLFDSSAATLEQVVVVAATAQPGYFLMFKNGAAFQITDAAPWVWNTQDQMVISFVYEATA